MVLIMGSACQVAPAGMSYEIVAQNVELRTNYSSFLAGCK